MNVSRPALLGGHPHLQRPRAAGDLPGQRRAASPRATSPIEVIVADDASTDDTAGWLADAHPGRPPRAAGAQRRLLRRGQRGDRRGAGRVRPAPEQRHRGDAPAGSRRAWPRSPIRPSARSRRWSWSGPTRPGSIRRATRTPLVGWPSKRGHGQAARSLGDRPPDRVFGASGSSAFYRAAALRRVGGFDPSFGSYYEDVDLAFRLRWAGYRASSRPACRILHEVSASYDHARPALQRGWRGTPRSSSGPTCRPPGSPRRYRAAPGLHAGAGPLAFVRGRARPFIQGKTTTLREIPKFSRPAASPGRLRPACGRTAAFPDDDRGLRRLRGTTSAGRRRATGAGLRIRPRPDSESV